MFGTSGIRGIYGRDITEELAMKVAAIFADKTLVVGRDIRGSGIPLSQAVTAGALSVGADVIEAKIVPTPTLALATSMHSCRGMVVTASHNPPEYNGLKLIEKGKEIGKDMEKTIQEEYKKKYVPGKHVGKIIHGNDIVEKHKEMVISMVDADSIRRKRPKVIVDSNGSAAVITPSLLSELGCEVTSINSSLERFSRPSEPSKENLSHLAGLVKESKADFAIAHDGDGDRCAIVDDTGEMLPLDVQLAMMIEHEVSLSSNKKIVSTVEASLVIREVVENAGGTIEITPVGSTYVGDALEQGKAAFGGEPCGEYVYSKGVHVPDAVLAAAKFTEIFCRKGKFSELKQKYRQYPMAREKFTAKDKHAVVEKVKKAISIKGKMRTDDGIRVDEEGGWFLIRASGTEPIVRLTMEYKTEERLEARKAQLKGIIEKNI